MVPASGDPTACRRGIWEMCLQGLCRSGGFRPLGSQWSWGWTLANQHHRRDISVDVLLMRHRLWFPMLPGKDAFKWGRVLVHSLSPCHPAQGTLRVWRGPEELGVRGGHTQGHPASPHPRYCPLPIRPITGCHSPFRADVLGLQRRPKWWPCPGLSAWPPAGVVPALLRPTAGADWRLTPGTAGPSEAGVTVGRPRQ